LIQRVVFPVFDANITEGMIGPWQVRVGDLIAVGDPLVEIVTDKATFTLESQAEGTLLAILAPEKSTVPNGYILALIGDRSDPLPDASAENEIIVAQAHKTMTEALPKTSPGAPHSPAWPQPASAGRLRATPAARRLAKDHGIDLSEISAPEPINEQAVRDYLKSKGIQ
jgi:pyruvate dehydrogenase E2 component (dihydrolipoamide acetyltransferase)